MSKVYTDAELEKIIIDGDLPALKAVLAENPEHLNYRGGKKLEGEIGSWAYISDGLDLVDGTSLLMCACRNGKNEIAKYLIEQGADVSIKHSVTERTALNYAAEVCDAEIIGLLVDAGADMKAKHSSTGDTPAHDAARKNNVSALVELLDRGFDIDTKACNYKNRKGDNLLSKAIQFGSADVVEMLINRSVDCGAKSCLMPRSPSENECSPLTYAMYASKNFHGDNKKILELIIDAEVKNGILLGNSAHLERAWGELSFLEEQADEEKVEKGDEGWAGKAMKGMQAKEMEFWLDAVKLLAGAGLKITKHEIKSSPVKNKEAHEAIKDSIVANLDNLPNTAINSGDAKKASQASLERP